MDWPTFQISQRAMQVSITKHTTGKAHSTNMQCITMYILTLSSKSVMNFVEASRAIVCVSKKFKYLEDYK